MLNLEGKVSANERGREWGEAPVPPRSEIPNRFLCTSSQERLCYQWLVVAQVIPLCFPVHVHDF